MCLVSSALAMIAPIPCIWPTLSSLRFLQRRRVKRQYNFPNVSSSSDKASSGVEEVVSMCCPGCSLSQELNMLQSEAAADVLRFPWETGL